MTRTYEVTGRYPVFRPLPVGTMVELSELAARYHVLEGALKPVETPVEEPAAALPQRPKRRGRR